MDLSSSFTHSGQRGQFVPPSSRPLGSYCGFRFGCFLNEQSIERYSGRYCLPHETRCGSSAHPQAHGLFDHKQNLGRLFSGRYRHSKEKVSRDVIVWSELTGTGSAGASYPLGDSVSSSKIRGICFYIITACAAIILFVPMLLEHPFVLMFDRCRRKAHYFVAKAWASLTVAPFMKIKYEGLENLPSTDAPAVFVSNHQSFLDIYTLLTLGRSFKFISKTSIFLYPIIGWAMFLLGVIPLKRMDSRSQLDCLKRCMAVIKEGASVCFFPEGTRSKDGQLGSFKKGAFSVAAKTGVPVVPITLVGTGKIMPAGMEGILNPGSVKVIIHPPILGKDPNTLCSEARNVIANELVRHA
ncbi:1-acyl-sn-glycerol-3-phosphate acyltransferase BAT2, chloroplastic-like isoform X2 [Andrographis paniculata]|uniref:1-acyl-sn-glycerol-3-phosphate acyltransferase BAT2, chloroplastic-like isoform X2 n=1 Tax=Andrographis paniculata TaxID=175694 RepID=UPI0021E8B851|nr:1-acyl-sn-glycerol-3-phosphate acyltransferase BAT2, chloroplastic-like isoform X2 [Andrographis paniculata]